MRIVVVRGASLVVVRGRWSFAVVMGGLRGCWAVDVVRWVMAVVHRSMSALHVVVDWAVVVFWAAGFVCVGGCVTWQQATWRGHSLSLTLVTWACDRRVWLSGGRRGLWAARDVHGGGCYVQATWWQAVVEVVVVGGRRKPCHSL